VSNAGYADSLCSQNWVLMTDFPRQLTGCRNCCPVPTLGIALSTPRAIEPILREAIERAPLTEITSAFETSEAREVARLAADRRATGLPGHELPGDVVARRTHPIRITGLWHARNSSLHYVEAIRRYGDTGCQAITAFRAWFWEPDPKTPAAFAGTHVEITDCDMKGAHFTTPLGRLEINGMPHVIVQVNSWEAQDHGVLRVTRESVTTMIMSPLRGG
jgi:hypothetical protein